MSKLQPGCHEFSDFVCNFVVWEETQNDTEPMLGTCSMTENCDELAYAQKALVMKQIFFPSQKRLTGKAFTC